MPINLGLYSQLHFSTENDLVRIQRKSNIVREEPMKRTVSFLILTAVFFYYAPAMAADRVVVVPLGSSSAKGSDQQLQYNDNGKTAGAELYYNKTNRRLEARGEVRTTDGAGNPRLWGHGRPGTGLMTHDTVSETCGNILNGYALSTQLVTWEGAAQACPAGTWVCSLDDLPLSGSCNVPQNLYFDKMDCDGSAPGANVNFLFGWVADSYSATSGSLVLSSNMGRSGIVSCNFYRVWCCWKKSVIFPPPLP